MKKLFLLILSIFLTGCWATPSKPLSKADSVSLKKAEMGADSIENANHPTDNFPQIWQAEIKMKTVVKEHVIDSGDLDFIEGNAKVATYKDSSFVFTGYIKVMNDAGVKVPMAYNVGIKWNGGEWQDNASWVVKFCNIDNP